MTDREIFKKVLEKVSELPNTAYYSEWLDYLTDDEIKYKRYYRVIFSHDFAKALWGEELTKVKYSHKVKGKGIEKLLNGKNISTDVEEIWYTIELPCWEFHLREMILCERPLIYLEQNSSI